MIIIVLCSYAVLVLWWFEFVRDLFSIFLFSMLPDTLILFLAGGFGAIIRDVLVDGKLVLPKVEDGALLLGFLGGVLIGAFAGYVVDNNPLTACLGGFAGYEIISNLLPKNEVK